MMAHNMKFCVLLTIFKSLDGFKIFPKETFGMLKFGRSNRGYVWNLGMVASSDLRSYIHHSEYPGDDFSHILGYGDNSHKLSKLQVISAKRIIDVKRCKEPINALGCGIDSTFYISSEDMIEEIKEFDELYGSPINIAEHIASKFPEMAIAAEFKRASPSKGDINMEANITQHCLEYARAGAAIISVLTEYEHFKGTLQDMKKVRLSTQNQYGRKRPAILRKDFIFDKYQLLEARVHGSDTVLLIVACLGVNQLTDLIAYSRSLGMEPLVEVHTDREMEVALDCGAKVIGVNNRNLHTFQLDLQTTERVIRIAKKRGLSWQPLGSSATSTPPDIYIAALSGISSSEDIDQFRRAGVACCLIGETLMKTNDPYHVLQSLLLGASAESNISHESHISVSLKKPIVKICGLTSFSDAAVALSNRAGLLGVIFAAKSPRAATEEQAREIVQVVRKYGERVTAINLKELMAIDNNLSVNHAEGAGTGAGAREGQQDISDQTNGGDEEEWFESYAKLLHRVCRRQPLVVGVFQNQSPEEINGIIERTGIDLVQLHGDESLSDIEKITVPVIKVLHCPSPSSPSPSSSTSSATSTSSEVTLTSEQISLQLNHQIQSLSGKAVALLLDTRLPGTSGGGAGAVFDWSIASHLKVPVIIAGGLSEANVQAAVSTKGVIGVDVSSGVEVAGKPGVKDHELVKKFLSNAFSSQY